MGAFRITKRVLMHADLNAVYNIIGKAIPEAFVN
jgi:transposase